MAKHRLPQMFQKIIDEQLTKGQPPYVQTTLQRLISEGYSQDDAKSMMAAIVAYHMGNMINNDEPFDNSEYRRLLEELPDFPQLD